MSQVNITYDIAYDIKNISRTISYALTYDIVGQHTILQKPTTMYDLRHRRSYILVRDDVVTYDIQEYRRYYVTYDIVGVTYDIVVTDLRYSG